MEALSLRALITETKKCEASLLFETGCICRSGKHRFSSLFYHIDSAWLELMSESRGQCEATRGTVCENTVDTCLHGDICRPGYKTTLME